jgi:hypothetical protein
MYRIMILAAVMTCAGVHAAHAHEQQPERKPEADLPKLSSERSNPAVERKPAPGQSAQGQPANPQPLGGAAVWGGGKSMAEWYIERNDKIVGLSDEQKQKIKAEYESRDKATKEFQASIEAKVKSVTAEMTEAFKSQDKEAIANAQKAYQELYAPLVEITKKSDIALQNILTVEQRNKRSDHQFAAMLESYAPGVELTEAQRREIRAGFGLSPGEYEVNVRGLHELIDKVLTAEQITAVITHRAATMMFASAKLTPDQQKKVAEQVAELTKDHKKTVNLDNLGYRRLYEHVEGLLTPQQKEAMKAQSARLVGAVRGAGGVQVQLDRGGAILSANPAPNPAANPAERKPAEAQTGEGTPSNVQVRQIPGGGIQVIIGEGNEAKKDGEPQQRLQLLQRQLTEAAQRTPADNKAGLRERVKRQHELTKKASKLMKKIDELGDGNKGKAHELWEELERVEGQLRQTFGPAHSSLAPGQTGTGWVLHSNVQAPGAPQHHPGTPQHHPSTPAQLPGAPLNPAPRPGAPAEGVRIFVAPEGTAPRGGGFGSGGAFQVAPGAAQPDLRTEVQALRRQVEELQSQVQKLSERK